MTSRLGTGKSLIFFYSLCMRSRDDAASVNGECWAKYFWTDGVREGRGKSVPGIEQEPSMESITNIYG